MFYGKKLFIEKNILNYILYTHMASHVTWIDEIADVMISIKKIIKTTHFEKIVF